MSPATSCKKIPTMDNNKEKSKVNEHSHVHPPRACATSPAGSSMASPPRATISALRARSRASCGTYNVAVAVAHNVAVTVAHNVAVTVAQNVAVAVANNVAAGKNEWWRRWGTVIVTVFVSTRVGRYEILPQKKIYKINKSRNLCRGGRPGPLSAPVYTRPNFAINK
jgi:hypothetical protein